MQEVICHLSEFGVYLGILDSIAPPPYGHLIKFLKEPNFFSYSASFNLFCVKSFLHFEISSLFGHTGQPLGSWLYNAHWKGQNLNPKTWHKTYSIRQGGGFRLKLNILIFKFFSVKKYVPFKICIMDNSHPQSTFYNLQPMM